VRFTLILKTFYHYGNYKITNSIIVTAFECNRDCIGIHIKADITLTSSCFVRFLAVFCISVFDS